MPSSAGIFIEQMHPTIKAEYRNTVLFAPHIVGMPAAFCGLDGAKPLLPPYLHCLNFHYHDTPESFGIFGSLPKIPIVAFKYYLIGHERGQGRCFGERLRKMCDAVL